MKIEAGKYYRTRDGRKVGPMSPHEDIIGGCEYKWTNTPDPKQGRLWRDDGTSGKLMPEHDLIAEWTDEPAAPKPSPFVTRRELVPGVYGRVTVYNAGAAGIDIHCSAVMTADELDEAAHLFAQLAEYLRETK